MIWRTLHLAVLLLGVGGMWMSCGSDGDSDTTESGAEDTDEDTPPGSVGGSGLTEVKGAFGLASADIPASGYEIWRLDHTDQEFERYTLDGNGAFTFAIDSFATDHVYSFYIVSPELDAVGPVDFGPTAGGVQSAIAYVGGLGFDMGTLLIELDDFGEPESMQTGLAASPAGGFTIAADNDLSLNDLQGPEGLARYGVGVDLTVVDPLLALYGVYLRDANAADYGQMLAESQRMRLWAEYDPELIVGLFLARAGSWQDNARIVDRLDRERDDAILWRDSTYSLPSLFSGIYSGYVWVNEPGVVVLRAWVDGGSLELPATTKLAFSLPPLVTGISLTGATITEIDYSTAGQNGLTTPFCFGGDDIVLQVEPPLDADGNPISGDDLDQIHVQFAYFDTASEVTVGAEDQATAWQDDGVEDLTLYRRSWVAANSSLTFTMADSEFGNANHQITLPAELFLTAAGDQSVTHMRATIAFRDTEIADQSGIAVWFKLSCD